MTSVTENVDKIKKAKIDNGANEKNKRDDKNKDEKSPSNDKSKILESIAKYQTNRININLETETAFCKKCSEVVTFDIMEIENHIENHSSATAVDSDLLYPSKLDQNLNRVDINDKTTQSSDDQHNDGVVNDTLKALLENVQSDLACSVDDFVNLSSENFEKCRQEEEVRNFSKVNKITYTGNNNQSYCRICEVHVPASFKSMKEHVEGTNHKIMVASSVIRTKTPDKLVKQSTKEFLDSVYDVKGSLYTGSIINEKYIIFRHSLHFIVENISRVRCILCDVNLPSYSDIEEHIKRHATKWLKVPIIASEKAELIREVRRGLYHCGFCHLVISGWTDMKRHLECSEHREYRTIWEHRLRCHLPNLQQYKMQKKLELMANMRLFNMFN